VPELVGAFGRDIDLPRRPPHWLVRARDATRASRGA
jgi:hypothetical protein